MKQFGLDKQKTSSLTGQSVLTQPLKKKHDPDARLDRNELSSLEHEREVQNMYSTNHFKVRAPLQEQESATTLHFNNF